MSFIIGILTLFLMINCVVLILLVLVQLPKKDAGAGMAFGAGTADALFGAGSGNALTKITKYTAVVFLVLSLFLDYLQTKIRNDNSSAQFTKLVEEKQQTQIPVTVPKLPAQQPKPSGLLSTLPASATNAAVSAVTNAAK